MWRPHYGAHLRLGIDRVNAGTASSAPEAQSTVGSSASGGEQVVLPWTPGKRFDSGVVLVKPELGRPARASICAVPYANEIVIATRRQLHTVRAPLETANLLGMGGKRGDMMVGNAYVMVMNLTVS